jgi:phospholipase/carboxylesterase
VALRHVDRPAAGDPVGALVFFHGHAGAPEDFIVFLDKIDPERRFHGYLPQGPHVVGAGRTSWFPRDSSDPPETQLAAVTEWLDSLPYPREQTVLGGWSQGANVAYTAAFAAGRARPAGILALGGGFRNGPPADLQPPLPPVAIAHGTADDAVPIDVARQARDVLQRAGATVLYRETDVRHEIDQAVIPDLRAFLAKLP